jgi:hypothetical protein
MFVSNVLDLAARGCPSFCRDHYCSWEIGRILECFYGESNRFSPLVAVHQKAGVVVVMGRIQSGVYQMTFLLLGTSIEIWFCKVLT